MVDNTLDARIVPLSEVLYDDEFNCRGTIQAADVVDLARDIDSHGLMSPVTVAPIENTATGYKYRLIAGFRRYVAHKVLKKPTIKVIVNKELADERLALYHNLRENIQRKDLDIIQEAKTVKKLRERGQGREEIAKELGMSSGWVQIRAMLLELPMEVQELAAAKVITQTDIRSLHTVMTHVSVEECLKKARLVNDAKAKGRAAIVESVKPATKRQRSKGEVMAYMAYMQDMNIPNGLWSRCLAWVCGEIDDSDLAETVEQHCHDNGIPFKSREQAFEEQTVGVTA